jgi:hypothetical protein
LIGSDNFSFIFPKKVRINNEVSNNSIAVYSYVALKSFGTRTPDHLISRRCVDHCANLFSDSVIGSEAALSFYELHIAVKDYCTFGDNRLIGVAVMQFKDIENQVQQGPIL